MTDDDADDDDGTGYSLNSDSSFFVDRISSLKSSCDSLLMVLTVLRPDLFYILWFWWRCLYVCRQKNQVITGN